MYKRQLLGLFILLCAPIFSQEEILDKTFGEDGKVIFHYGMEYGYSAYDVAVQNDGKIVIVGNIELADKSEKDVFVLRLKTDGTWDNSFQDRGFNNFKITDSDFEYAKKVKIVGDKILIGGFSGTKGFIMRLNLSDGEPDESFGNSGNGIVTTDLLSSINDLCIVSQINTYDIVCAGAYSDGFESKPALVRFTENGHLLTAFGSDGRATINSTITGYFTGISASANTLFASGTKHKDGVINDDALIAGFNINGSCSGHVTIDAPVGNRRNNIHSLYRNIFSGAVIFCGDYTSDSGISAYVCKLKSNGNIDRTFGDNGYRFTDNSQTMNSIVHQSDGKIILGGYSDLSGNNDFNLIRLTSGGQDDLTFNTVGWGLTDFNGADDWLQKLVIQPDSKLIAVGNSQIGSEHSIAIARYITKNPSAINEINQSDIKLSIFPNPVQNKEINVNYTIHKKGKIDISLFSIDGKKIADIISGTMGVGEHKARFILPQTIESGLYFIRLQSQNQQISLKLIVL